MIGKQLLNYRILDVLPSSSAIRRYKAIDSKLNREVLLTVLPSDLFTKISQRKTLLKRLQKISSLNVPIIATIIKIDELQDGSLLVISAYYGDRTLAQEVAGRGLSLRRSINTAFQIAKGLTRTHALGVFHGGLTAEHITLLSDDEIKIENWALAELLTRPDASADALMYYCPSPEQITGQTVISHCDVWSIGVLLYQMITAESPFSGTSIAERHYSVLNEEPDRLKQNIAEKIPAKLQELIDLCLRKDPYERPSMQQVADKLDELAQSMPASINTGSRRGMGNKATAFLSVGLACLISVAALLWYGHQMTNNQTVTILLERPKYLNEGMKLERFVEDFEEDLLSHLELSNIESVLWSHPKDVTRTKHNLRLESTFLQVGDTVRISIKLIEVSTQTNIWAKSFNRTSSDLTEAFEGLAEEVVVELKQRVLAKK